LSQGWYVTAWRLRISPKGVAVVAEAEEEGEWAEFRYAELRAVVSG
jgi:hypothetical protein